MAEHSDSGHGGHGGGGEQHSHGGLGFYIGIAVFLGVVTGLEIWCVVDTKNLNHPGNESLVRGLLYTFSIAKFAAVVMFFMHLFYDKKLLTFLFVAGLVCAAGTMVALLRLIPQGILNGPDKNPGIATAFNRHITAPPSNLKGDPKNGPALVKKFGCIKCHTIPGQPEPEIPTCPDWEGLADRAGSRKPGYSAKQYIEESIAEPSAYIVDGYQDIMPHLRKQMTDQEYADLVAYALTMTAKK